MGELIIELVVPPQPTATTCGPTCLYGVYDHLGEAVTHAEVIEETNELEEGGTLAVHLAAHALRRGLRVTLYSFNLELLDPTWFTRPGVDLRERLASQARHRSDAKLREASWAYEKFLGMGGQIRMAELEVGLLEGYLARGVPLLTGVSATYLYQSARELPDGSYDDLHGRPQGHFVVIAGLRGEGRDHEVLVHDPWHNHGRGTRARYWLPLRRFVHAMLLGVLTYDGTLLAIEGVEENEGT